MQVISDVGEEHIWPPEGDRAVPLEEDESTETDSFAAMMMEEMGSETDSDYTSYWRDWVSLVFSFFC